MDWGEKFILRLQIFTLGMAAICPVFLIWWSSTAMRQIDSYYWPVTPGLVEETTAKTWLDEQKNRTMYFGRVVYSYSVNGREYKSDLTDLGPGTKRMDPREALADVGKYRPGSQVRVFYDPNDPSVGVIENGIPTVHLILFTLLGIGSVVGLVASPFILRSWLRTYRSSKAAA